MGSEMCIRDRLRVEMRQEIAALQRKLGLTTIYVTHDQEEANAVADRIAVLDAGRIQQIGPPIALYDRPANRFVAAFLGTANMIEGTLDAAGRFAADGFALGGIEGAAGAACLSFRPQDVQLSHGGQGRVLQREFLGGTIRYAVALGPHRIIVDTVHHREAPTFEVGAPVGIAIDPGRVALLR